MLLERLEGKSRDEAVSGTRGLRSGVAVASRHGAEQAEAEGHSEGHQVFERGGAGVHAGSLAGGDNKPRRQNADRVTRTGPALWRVRAEGDRDGSERTGGEGAGPHDEADALLGKNLGVRSQQ